jgi:hypothetical protein
MKRRLPILLAILIFLSLGLLVDITPDAPTINVL